MLKYQENSQNAKLNYETCKTWTTDGFYRETKENDNYKKILNGM